MSGSRSIARTVRHLQGAILAPYETLAQLQSREHRTRPSYKQVLSQIRPGYRTLRKAHFEACGSAHVRRIMAGDYLLHQLDATYRRFETDVQLLSARHNDQPEIAGTPQEWMDRRLMPFHRWDAISYPELSLCDQLEAMLIGMSEKGVFAAGGDLPLHPYWRWPVSLLEERISIATWLFGAPEEAADPKAGKPHLKGEKQLARLYAPSHDDDGSLPHAAHPGASNLVVRTKGGPDANRLVQVIYATGYPFALPSPTSTEIGELTTSLASFWWARPAPRHDLVALNLRPAENGPYQTLAFTRTHWGSPLTVQF